MQMNAKWIPSASAILWLFSRIHCKTKNAHTLCKPVKTNLFRLRQCASARTMLSFMNYLLMLQMKRYNMANNWYERIQTIWKRLFSCFRVLQSFPISSAFDPITLQSHFFRYNSGQFNFLLHACVGFISTLFIMHFTGDRVRWHRQKENQSRRCTGRSGSANSASRSIHITQPNPANQSITGDFDHGNWFTGSHIVSGHGYIGRIADHSYYHATASHDHNGWSNSVICLTF